jgi:hypothetical protein
MNVIGCYNVIEHAQTKAFLSLEDPVQVIRRSRAIGREAVQQTTRYETLSADRRRISQLALSESGKDSFGRVGEIALDIHQALSVSGSGLSYLLTYWLWVFSGQLADARRILGLAREPAAEAVVGFQITDLPLVGHGILQDTDQANSYRWPRVISGFIELSCEVVGR